MDSRAKALSIFIGFNALIGAGAFACISLGGLSPQRIVPMTAILAAINIYTFARRFSAAKREVSFPALGTTNKNMTQRLTLESHFYELSRSQQCALAFS